ncbi:putative ADP-ribosylation factor GTPase-activating protein AGD14 [Vitis vinifera]|uniref:Putative ADP-ribosylation factor GTPase-activating protein AGD14 n=1 Tax=Vitis vinifera TaxID=29760 RepID=A0A438DHA0_VITVI|nr:putative ADP-ribosylation factor GTPase-activating protein AGD14 [Vitis vinifera]
MQFLSRIYNYWLFRCKRTTSSGSFGSLDSNSMSIKSANSSNLMDVVSEPEQSTGGAHQDKISELHALPRSSVSGYPVSLDLFDAPFAPETVTSSASSIDLFQFPVTSSIPSVDLFQQSSVSSVSSMNPHQASQTSPPSAFDFFAEINQQQSQPPCIKSTTENCTPAKIPSTDGGPPGKLDSVLSIDASMQWPLFQDSNAHGPSSSMSNPWDQGLHNVQASTNVTSTPVSCCRICYWTSSLGSIQQSSEPHVAVSKPSTADQFLGSRVLEDPDNDGIQRAASAGGPPLPSVPTHVTGPPDAPSELALMGGTQSQGTDKKSSNPFDLPYDSDLEQSSMNLGGDSCLNGHPEGQSFRTVKSEERVMTHVVYNDLQGQLYA